MDYKFFDYCLTQPKSSVMHIQLSNPKNSEFVGLPWLSFAGWWTPTDAQPRPPQTKAA
jgi:hypothetical protein